MPMKVNALGRLLPFLNASYYQEFRSLEYSRTMKCSIQG